MLQRILALYQRRFGDQAPTVVVIPQDGSHRELYRLIDHTGASVVGVFGPDELENTAFISFSHSLRSANVPVPEIFASDVSNGVYIEQDLGDVTLHSATNAANGFSDEIVSVYKHVMRILAHMQVSADATIDYTKAYPFREYDRDAIMFDLEYFQRDYLSLLGVKFNPDALKRDFDSLCDFLLTAERTYFVHRDFQSRNIMLPTFDQPTIIDYQGGRRGSLHYDVAKLLYEPSAQLPPELRDELLSVYIDEVSKHVQLDRDEFQKHLHGFLLLRLMQGLAAYSKRGIQEGKTQFLSRIQPALNMIDSVLADGLLQQLPELKSVFRSIAHNGVPHAATQ